MTTVISDNLFEKILLSPLHQGANKLRVVSGYATAGMVSRHLNYANGENAEKREFNLTVELLVGMCPKDGLLYSNHSGFKELMEQHFMGVFECSYIHRQPTVHSKVYTWLQDEKPICSFAGSANYTQNAFSKNQQEIMVPCDPKEAHDYYNSLNKDSIFCTHNDVEMLIGIYQGSRAKQQATESDEESGTSSESKQVTISLLMKDGEVGKTSGLNWGKREGRNQNQAYIAIPAKIYRSGFFPDRGVHFSVQTDDEKNLIFSRVQDNGKSLHTPLNNALMGEYFRGRMGIPSGAFVTREALLQYGRTDVTFYKVDEENYHMDFSVSK